MAWRQRAASSSFLTFFCSRRARCCSRRSFERRSDSRSFLFRTSRQVSKALRQKTVQKRPIQESPNNYLHLEADLGGNASSQELHVECEILLVHWCAGLLFDWIRVPNYHDRLRIQPMPSRILTGPLWAHFEAADVWLEGVWNYFMSSRTLLFQAMIALINWPHYHEYLKINISTDLLSLFAKSSSGIENKPDLLKKTSEDFLRVSR